MLIHIRLMRKLGEERHGVFDRYLAESALARPRQSASYGETDPHTQAAVAPLPRGCEECFSWGSKGRVEAAIAALVPGVRNSNGQSMPTHQDHEPGRPAAVGTPPHGRHSNR